MRIIKCDKCGVQMVEGDVSSTHGFVIIKTFKPSGEGYSSYDVCLDCILKLKDWFNNKERSRGNDIHLL